MWAFTGTLVTKLCRDWMGTLFYTILDSLFVLFFRSLRVDFLSPLLLYPLFSINEIYLFYLSPKIK